MARLYDPIEYNWAETIDSSLSLKKGEVLVKKGFLGRIKACVVDLHKDVEVVSYRTVSKNLAELSDKDVLLLKNYFEGRRMAKQVQLLTDELAFRRKLLIDKNATRPKGLKTVLKYNIKKKSKKIKRYEGKTKIKFPKKDFFILSTQKRTFKEFKFEKFGFSIVPSFILINPQIYAKALNKHKLDESALVKEILSELYKILNNYLENSNRVSRKGKGIDYEYSLDEDLFSDFELKNEILIFGEKYGIRFDKMLLIYAKDKEKELVYESEGLSKEQISKIQDEQSTVEIEKSILEQEQKKNLIQQFIDYGIRCDENGILESSDRMFIIELKGIEDVGQNISIFDLTDLEVIELSKIHTHIVRK